MAFDGSQLPVGLAMVPFCWTSWMPFTPSSLAPSTLLKASTKSVRAFDCFPQHVCTAALQQATPRPLSPFLQCLACSRCNSI